MDDLNIDEPIEGVEDWPNNYDVPNLEVEFWREWKYGDLEKLGF